MVTKFKENSIVIEVFKKMENLTFPLKKKNLKAKCVQHSNVYLQLMFYVREQFFKSNILIFMMVNVLNRLLLKGPSNNCSFCFSK